MNLMNHLIPDRRVGRFYLTTSILEHNRCAAFDILQHCIIFNADFDLYADAVEYSAWCGLFRPLEEGYIMPTYIFTIDEDTGELTAE